MRARALIAMLCAAVPALVAAAPAVATTPEGGAAYNAADVAPAPVAPVVDGLQGALPDAGGVAPGAPVAPAVPAVPTTDDGAAPLPSTLPRRTVAGSVAKIASDGLAMAPQAAPASVKRAIWAANDLQGKPYVYGGGHASFTARGYDCSGSVSYLLRGGSLLSSPMASGALSRWGTPGPGRWITVYANAGHAFAVVAGLRLDTSAAGDPRGAKGPRWRPAQRAVKGFKRRHPAGL